MVSFLMRTNSFKRIEDNERSGGSTLKPGSIDQSTLYVRLKNDFLNTFDIVQYQCSTNVADTLRDSLINSEQFIIEYADGVATALKSSGVPDSTGSNRGYPDDMITGRLSYYNILRDVERWNITGFPFVKAVVADYLQLKPKEKVGINSWGNVLRLDRKIFPHLHFEIPSDWKENKSSVCGNIFLGAEEDTCTTYYLDGEHVDVPNVYGQVVLFPPNIPHAVRTYKGSGVRVSAAFDVFSPSRDTRGIIDGDNWMYWTHGE